MAPSMLVMTSSGTSWIGTCSRVSRSVEKRSSNCFFAVSFSSAEHSTLSFLAARVARHGLSLRDRLVGYLPRYAGLAARLAPLANWRNNSSVLRMLLERLAGISAPRSRPPDPGRC